MVSGKLKPIGNTGAKRHPSFPDTPTFQEQGIDVEAYLWVGLFTTAGLPDATLNQLRDLVRKAAQDPTFVEALKNVQVIPDYRDVNEFKTFFEADYKRMAKAVQKIGKI